jgi:hypothetical protein
MSISNAVLFFRAAPRSFQMRDLAGFLGLCAVGIGYLIAHECLAQASLLSEPAMPLANVPRGPMVEVEARFVRATAAQMQEALGSRQPLESNEILNPEQLRKTLVSLGRSKARVFSHPRAVTVSGQRAVVQAVRELRYPTEFDPTDPARPDFYTPTAFETRDVGVTFEFEPIADPDGQVILNVVPSVTNFLGFIDFGSISVERKLTESDPIAALLKMPLKGGALLQPIFTTEKLTTVVILPSGNTALLGLPSNGSEPSPDAPAGGPEGAAALAPGERAIAPKDIAPSGGLQTFVFITARLVAPEKSNSGKSRAPK